MAYFLILREYTIGSIGRKPEERWIQLDFVEHFVISGFEVEGGKEYKITQDDPNSQFVINDFVVHYQYDYASDDQSWHQYKSSTGIVVSWN